MDAIYQVPAVEPGDTTVRVMHMVGEPVWSNATLADMIGGDK